MQSGNERPRLNLIKNPNFASRSVPLYTDLNGFHPDLTYVRLIQSDKYYSKFKVQPEYNSQEFRKFCNMSSVSKKMKKPPPLPLILPTDEPIQQQSIG